MDIIKGGIDISKAKKALILIHGRGADAGDFLSLGSQFKTDDFAMFAPQASGNTWYPYSFLVPLVQNEPFLSSSLGKIENLLDEIEGKGISPENIYFVGFSQGACLTLEFVARNATSFGGVVAFTGGLIGPEVSGEKYEGNFNSTPILITTGDPDPHVPVDRVKKTVEILNGLGAEVRLEIFPGKPHSISKEEIDLAISTVFKRS